jgi:hypothetical protein
VVKVTTRQQPSQYHYLQYLSILQNSFSLSVFKMQFTSTIVAAIMASVAVAQIQLENVASCKSLLHLQRVHIL